MPTQKDISAPAKTIPAAQLIYDAIMGEIEPDLCTAVAAANAIKRDGETEIQFAARMDRYRKAFDLYNQCFAAYVGAVETHAAQTRTDARVSEERKTHVIERHLEDQLLDRIANL